MINIKLFLFFILLIVVYTCKTSLVLLEDTTIKDIYYQKGSTLHAKKRIKLGYLKTNVTIGSVTYLSVLTNDIKTNSIIYIADDYTISLGEAGDVLEGYLFTNTTIDGIRYRSGATFVNSNGYLIGKNSIRFYENQKVKQGFLADDTFIDGIKYRYRIHFYPNGKVEKGLLAQTYFTNDLLYGKENYYIEFYNNGQVKQARLIKKMILDGVTYPRGMFVSYSETGRVIGKGRKYKIEKIRKIKQTTKLEKIKN